MWKLVAILVLMLMLGEFSWVEARPPNILFILADDLGYGMSTSNKYQWNIFNSISSIGDLGTYWNNNTYGRIKTPNLNQMAAEGSLSFLSLVLTFW